MYEPLPYREPTPDQHSARINRLIKRLVREPHFHDLRFTRGVFLCSSCLESCLALPAMPDVPRAYLLVNEHKGDQRISGLLLGNPTVDHHWESVGGHSDSSWTNLILDSTGIDWDEVGEEFAYGAVNGRIRAGLGKNYRHTRSWWDGMDDQYGRIIAVHAGNGSGGVDAYRSQNGLYLDYTASCAE